MHSLLSEFNQNILLYLWCYQYQGAINHLDRSQSYLFFFFSNLVEGLFLPLKQMLQPYSVSPPLFHLSNTDLSSSPSHSWIFKLYLHIPSCPSTYSPNLLRRGNKYSKISSLFPDSSPYFYLFPWVSVFITIHYPLLFFPLHSGLTS